MIKEVSDINSSSEHEIKKSYIQKKICKEIYDCKEETHMHKTIRLELRIMKEVISNQLVYMYIYIYILETPISHMIIR